jgi:putative GTP pyrophosphokinase
MMVQPDFDHEYEQATKLLGAFGDYLESLLTILLENGSIRIHRIDSRVKGKNSTQLKLARPSKEPGAARPRSLDTITDLLGLRIITYFTDDVDRVAELIIGQFAIDWDNFVDKRALLDPDRFGYLSLHYIAQLDPSHTGTPEFQRYGHIKFEIQIRSILQHAWAEIEHDLGYKTQAAVPYAVRRQFSLLAGLLEVADRDFVTVRQELGKHQDETKATIEGGDPAGEILIDQDSLAAFVRSSRLVSRLDKLIARARHVTVQDEIDNQFLGQEARQLLVLGFRSIEELNGYLEQNTELLAAFTERWLALSGSADRVGRSGQRVPVPIGIALYYACALRYAQDSENGKMPQPGQGDWEYNSALLRRALRESTSGGNSPGEAASGEDSSG